MNDLSVPQKEQLSIENKNDKFVDITILSYFVGLSCFKSGNAFDAFMCRILFVIMIFAVTFCSSRKKTANRFYSLKAYSLFFSFYCISFLWGNIEDGMYYFNNIVEILGDCYAFGKMISSRKDIIKYSNHLLISIVAMIILLMIRNNYSIFSGYRHLSNIGLNINDVGFRCGTGMLIALFFAENNKFYLLICLLTSALSLLSGSRKALFYICGTVISYGLVKLKGIKRFSYFIISLILVGLIIYSVFTIPILYDLLGSRFYKLYLTLDSGSRYYAESGNQIVDTSYEYRRYFKQVAMQMFYEKPIWGCGANSFSSEIVKTINIKTYSHCNYTELLATLGLIGLLLYYIPILKIFVYATKEIKKNDTIIIMTTLLIVFKLFLDYESVTYISVFNNLVLIMFMEYVANNQSKKDNELKNDEMNFVRQSTIQYSSNHK